MIVACTRVKDGKKFVLPWITQMVKICEHVLILDDGSTDGTSQILQYAETSFPNRVHVTRQTNVPFDGGRDWQILHDAAATLKPDWILALDIDELIDEDDLERFATLTATKHEDIQAWTFPFYYLWNDEQTYRFDGNYEKCHVIRLFRFDPARTPPKRASHSQMCSDELDRRLIRTADVRVKHFGYLDPKDRLEKFLHYTKRDADPQKAGAGDANYEHIRQEESVILRPYLTKQEWEKMKVETLTRLKK